MKDYMQNTKHRFNRKIKINGLQSEQGFTLVELIVSMGLFSIVLLISLVALLSLTVANKRVQSVQVATDAVSFVLDDIVREIRLGYNYSCGTGEDEDVSAPADCPLGNNYLALSSGFDENGRTKGDIVVYQWDEDEDSISKLVTGGSLEHITSESVRVDNFAFYVDGSGSNDGQAKILIILQATVDAGKPSETTLNLQTTVTQRFTDN